MASQNRHLGLEDGGRLRIEPGCVLESCKRRHQAVLIFQQQPCDVLIQGFAPVQLLLRGGCFGTRWPARSSGATSGPQLAGTGQGDEQNQPTTATAQGR